MVTTTSPVVPREWRLKRTSGVIDGSLADYPPSRNARLDARPARRPGVLEGYMGYADEGLYLAFDIADNKCFTDPNSFWRAADCPDDVHPRLATSRPARWGLTTTSSGFCPLADQGRAFGILGARKARRRRHI